MELHSDAFAMMIRRVRTGGKAEMDELIRRFSPILERFAAQLVGRLMQAHVDGEDLVQVVHIILWQGLRSGKFEVRTPKALLALAKTLLIRQAARQWRKVKLNDPINSVETRLARTHLCRYLVATPFQRCQLSSFETADLVDRFMCGLDDIDQQLLLRRLDGLSTAEVAETLQVDSGFLRVRLGRMRKKFAGFCPELACQP